MIKTNASVDVPQLQILFFGSTTDSVIVLNKLINSSYKPIAIVTQPKRAVGRHQTLTPTPVEIAGTENEIPVYHFETVRDKPWIYENEEEVVKQLLPLNPELILSASYGQKIPQEIIKSAKYGGLNIHPSRLPRWRGTDPVPWTILAGDTETGATIVTLSDTFDQGLILAQEKIKITDFDLPDHLRSRLFQIGAELLIKKFDKNISNLDLFIKDQFNDLKVESPTYARRLTREDGYIPWELLNAGITGKPYSISEVEQFNNLTILRYLNDKINLKVSDITYFINKMCQALNPWPGVWSNIKIQIPNSKFQIRRIKILNTHIENDKLMIDSIQLEGKKPVNYQQFKKYYL
jgi:methionyl-tRNA formyltransferase